MDRSIIFLIIQFIFLIAAFIIGKLQSNGLIQPETIDDLSSKFYLFCNYADALILWAKQYMQDYTGPEKMEDVVYKLLSIADGYNINISEDEIRGIAQKEYNILKSTDQV